MVRSAALAAVAGWTLPALAPVVPTLAGSLRIPLRCAAPGAVALTFDDGPHPLGTPAALEALAAADARATFFLVAEQVQRLPSLAAEIVDAGHAVGFHGGRHRNLLRLPPAAIARDFDAGAGVLATALGVGPVLHRAPYGIYSWPALSAVRARGWTPVLWSRWGRDLTRSATFDSVVARAAGGIRAGDVVLLHDADDYCAPDCWRATAAALPRILERIDAAGLRPVALRGPADLAHGSGR
jgi:peptidoglycan-N-acetylglucosamine deacetylase